MKYHIPLAALAILFLSACPDDTNPKQDMSAVDMMDQPNDLSGDSTPDLNTTDMSKDAADSTGDMFMDMVHDLSKDLTDMQDMVADQTNDPCDAITCDHGGVCDQGTCVCQPGWSGDKCQAACELKWSAPSMPVAAFNFGAGLSDVLWNDPTILKTGTQWSMWLTGGITPASKTDNKVKVYRATSTDGLDWQLNTTALIEPGPSGQWDDKAIETPSVIQDGNGLYHLYYSGASINDGPGVYAIGHATSPDGTTWTKDPNNPILTTAQAGQSDWGVFTVAEPAAMYNPNTGTIHLYYVSAGGSANVTGQFAILLATSTDGSNFTHHVDAQNNREPVWSLTPSYAADMRYRGFSTPAITMTSDGTFHLTHDVVQAPADDPNGFDQVAISHATSTDGLSFTEQSANLIVRGALPWFAREIRAPYLIQDGATLRLWFAGGQPLIPAGPPDFIDWSQHVESFGYIEGTYTCP